MTVSFARRLGVLAATTALGAGALGVVTTAPAQAAEPTSATSATNWALGQLTDGVFATDAARVSATMDLGFSLRANGAAQQDLGTLKAGIDTHAGSFIGDTGNAGRVAKLIAFYVAAGSEPDGDLITRLENDVDDATGRLGTASNVYDQVWAVSALHGTNSDELGTATAFLLGQKCPEGAWGYWLDESTCVSDVDATAWTVIALAPQQGEPAVDDAIMDAVTWLRTQQHEGGGFGANPAWGTGDNANSTGLAGWALGLVGDSAAAGAAADWIVDHQLKSGVDAGAVAWDDAALARVAEAGIDPGELGQWQMATAQALAALAYLPEPSAPDPQPVNPTPGTSPTPPVLVCPLYYEFSVRNTRRGKTVVEYNTCGMPGIEARIKVRKRVLSAPFVGTKATFETRHILRRKKQLTVKVYVGNDKRKVTLNAKRR